MMECELHDSHYNSAITLKIVQAVIIAKTNYGIHKGPVTTELEEIRQSLESAVIKIVVEWYTGIGIKHQQDFGLTTALKQWNSITFVNAVNRIV